MSTPNNQFSPAVPPAGNPIQQFNSDQSETSSFDLFEKFLLGLLFFITIFQFGGFGMQSVRYILSLIFDVAGVVATPLDAFIGLIAMVASVYIFIGAFMQWNRYQSALKYIAIGSALFVAKNIFDLLNETMLYALRGPVVTVDQITELAAILGNQFFQLAFWCMVYGFFRVVTKRRAA